MKITICKDNQEEIFQTKEKFEEAIESYEKAKQVEEKEIEERRKVEKKYLFEVKKFEEELKVWEETKEENLEPPIPPTPPLIVIKAAKAKHLIIKQIVDKKLEYTIEIEKTREEKETEEKEKKIALYKKDVKVWIDEVVRPKRDVLLKAADYILMMINLEDFPKKEKKEELLVYRQDLRDFPKTLKKYDENVAFPFFSL